MHVGEEIPPGRSGGDAESMPPPWFADFEKRQQARLDKIVR